MKKYSTGALTKEQHARQDELYHQQHKYDYVIIGTGMSALSVGALLANSGHRVCLLEAHDIPGGYAHTFKMNDFSFCAQVHYIWGCDDKQAIGKVLKKLRLQDDITFERLDPEGYDHIILPDGKRIKTPNGFERFAQNINTVYPGNEKNVQRFFSIIEKLNLELGLLPEKIRWWNILSSGLKFLTLIRYRNKTLQDLFDECGLPLKVQTILSGNAGDLMSPPEQLSLIAYAGLVGGYNSGAYYPTKHFKYFIDRLAQFITDHPGCHIYYETKVSNIKTEENRVQEVHTECGKVFKADRYICNMDPQAASEMIGREKFPPEYLPALSYEYTQPALFVYLGVKGINLADYGFGNHNTWHLEQWDMNASWRDVSENRYEKPWIFMSTPTLHSNYPGIAPEGCQILEFGTVANYDHFKKLHNTDPAAYRKEKHSISEKLFQIIEEKHIPNLSKHIALKVVGTPTTNTDFCLAPFGNAYGSVMSPKNMGLQRLKSDTPFENLFWCNASSGFASIYGTTLTGSKLYTTLTGDSI
jgi:phytoene dehydrogenase-like protein